MGIPDHVTCLLRNLYQGQEATVRTRHGKMDYISSPCIFDFDTEYIMQNAGMDKSQAGIKISWRSINNLRYVEDTTQMAENDS